MSKILIKEYSSAPRVSIIIPSLYFEQRKKYIDNLIKDIENQTFKDLEIIFVIQDERQGRAINTGAKIARGEILITMDDDTKLGNNKVIENIFNALKSNENYGLVGAACEIPPDCSVFLKKAFKQIPRRFFPTQKEDRESDMVQHPCLGIRKDLFFRIGGEDEELIRGLDPILRYKVRKTGYKVVIIKNTWIYHLLPPTFSGLLKMYYRNGIGSAFAKKFFPDRIYDVDSGYTKGYIPQKTPFLMRILRAIITLIINCIEFKYINLTALLSYYWGFTRGYILGIYKC